jgi:hypothetical protein
MARFIRRRLRLIRYHSAPRRSSAWSTATDMVLAAALLLGWPAAMAADQIVRNERDGATLRVRLTLDSDGAVRGEPISVATITAPAARDRVPYGECEVLFRSRSQGWPLISTIKGQEPGYRLNLFGQPQGARWVEFAADSPERGAIEEAIAASERDPAMAWLAAGEPGIGEAEFRWCAWLGNGMLWCLMLLGGGIIGVQGARLAAFIAGLRVRLARARLRRRGRCAACGYDLRGLEFSERCPECGTLAE